MIVKVHGVFPSNYKKPASSRAFQFHQVCVGDSEEVVTPFMQVGTYPTRSFATLGPSELQPPFTGVYFQCCYTSILLYSTGQVSIPILLLSNLQRFVFLINSRFFFFNAKQIRVTLFVHLFSRSYEINLPSSFNTVILTL